MEESLNAQSRDIEEQAGAGFISSVEDAFGLPERDYSQYSPLTLAYIGDAVFDIVVRTVIVRRSNMQAAKLHKLASSFVNARSQAELIKKLLPYLTEEEAAVYRRGRNSRPEHTAKNAARDEYLEATGFEALVGFLYLQKRYERIMELIASGIEI